MLKFIVAEEGHAAKMARTGLRPQDHTECEVMGFHDRSGLLASLRASRTAWTGIGEKGWPCVMFGVAESVWPGVGVPWLLATRHLSPKDLIREGPRFIELMHSKYRTLSNHVHAANERAVRWLAWAGFTIEPAIPMGPHRAFFHPFHRTI